MSSESRKNPEGPYGVPGGTDNTSSNLEPELTRWDGRDDQGGYKGGSSPRRSDLENPKLVKSEDAKEEPL